MAKPHPPETREAARRMRDEGSNYSTIARALGLPVNTVIRWLDPAVAERTRAASRRLKESYRGTCVDCGGPTSYAGKPGEVSSLRCKWCVTGKTPEKPPPDRRRRVPVRLSDIPVEVRLEGAREANRHERGELERREILFAALFPTDHVYWVAASAFDSSIEAAA